MKPVSILHISDIHFSRQDRKFIVPITNALIARITQLLQVRSQIDAVCLTGDLVWAGDDKDSYDLLINEFIFPLLDLTECHNRFFFVPGNHDASRKVVQADFNLHHGLHKKFEQIDDYLVDQESCRDLQSNKFSTFDECMLALQSPHRHSNDPLCPTYYVKEIDTLFVCINSALTTLTGLEETSDERKLFFPVDLLREILESSPQAQQTVFLMHHPVDWLTRKCREDLNQIIQSHRGVLLFGHMHNERPQQIRDPQGLSFRQQSGALYSKDKTFQGFSVLNTFLGTPHVRIDLETFFPSRSEFDLALDIAPKGRFFSSDQARHFWVNPPVPIDLISVRNWVRTALFQHMIKEFVDPFSDRDLNQIFVEPPLTKSIPLEAEVSVEGVQNYEDKVISLEEVLKGENTNLLIVAPRDFGRTVLLQKGSLIVAQCADELVQFVPIHIKASSFEGSNQNIPRHIQNGMPEEVLSDWPIKRLLENGICTIFIDDFKAVDSRSYRLIVKFIKQYPGNRYVIATEPQSVNAISPHLQIELPVPYQTVRIGALKGRHIRNLIAKVNDTPPGEVSVLLNKIVSDMVAMNIPMTASNATILIKIHDERGNFSPVNRAVLIERYVELLLNKASASEFRRETFDFRNKTHFLSWIAKMMVREENYTPSHQWMETESLNYLRKFGLAVSATDWISQFVTARIFEAGAEHIGFRYRAFCEFFVAKAMQEDREFFDYITDMDRYLSFGREIEYYAGLTRNDLQLLNLISDRYKSLDDAISEISGWSPNLEKLDNMSAPIQVSEGRKIEIFEKVKDELDLPDLDLDEKDDLLDDNVPADLGANQNVRRSKAQYEAHAVASRYLGNLILYSTLLKNSELIDDVEKRKHLHDVLYAWSKFMMFALNLVPALAKSRRVDIAGITFAVLAHPSKSAEELGYDLYLQLPTNFSKSVFEVLGTDKLRLQLESNSGGDGDEGSFLFFKRALSLDLRTPKSVELAAQAFRKFKRGGYLYEAFVMKMHDWLGRNLLKQDERTEAVKVLAGAIADRFKLTGSKRATSFANAEARLRRKSLVSLVKQEFEQ